MTAVLSPVELAVVVATPVPVPPKRLTRLTVPCPTCGTELPGDLAGCRRPSCVAAEIAADVALDRAVDL